MSNSQAIVVGDVNESHGLRSVTGDSFWGMGSGFHGDGSFLTLGGALAKTNDTGAKIEVGGLAIGYQNLDKVGDRSLLMGAYGSAMGQWAFGGGYFPCASNNMSFVWEGVGGAYGSHGSGTFNIRSPSIWFGESKAWDQYDGFLLATNTLQQTVNLGNTATNLGSLYFNNGSVLYFAEPSYIHGSARIQFSYPDNQIYMNGGAETLAIDMSGLRAAQFVGNISPYVADYFGPVSGLRCDWIVPFSDYNPATLHSCDIGGPSYRFRDGYFGRFVYVYSNATSGVQAVNYQTMTNYVARAGFLTNVVEADTLQTVMNRGRVATNAMALGIGVTATGRCAFAHGAGATWITGIQADGAGSTAMGANDSSGGTRMMATGKGSLAGGYITSTYMHGGGVHADGVGSFAWNEGAWAKHDWSVVFSDTEWMESPTSKTFTVSMANGIYLRGGTTEVENASAGKGAVNYRTMTNWVLGRSYITATQVVDLVSGVFQERVYTPTNEFAFTNDGTSVTITGYAGTNAHVSIPPMIGRLPVRTIGNLAFSGNTSLKTILGSSIVRLGASVFLNCSGLTDAEFPASTNVGWGAFVNCEALARVNYPVATGIGYSAFDSCGALTSLSFPMATTIEGQAFLGCGSLTNIVLGGPAPALSGDMHFYLTPAELVVHHLAGYVYPAVLSGPPGYGRPTAVCGPSLIATNMIGAGLSWDGTRLSASGTWTNPVATTSLVVNGYAVSWKTNVFWAYATSTATERTAFTNIYLGR